MVRTMRRMLLERAGKRRAHVFRDGRLPATPGPVSRDASSAADDEREKLEFQEFAEEWHDLLICAIYPANRRTPKPQALLLAIRAR
jgi:hypothetical protein